MKAKKLVAGISACALGLTLVSPTAIHAASLSWKDGALANYYFTYGDGDEGIANVSVSDTNETYTSNIEEGQTITTKTGTIVWRDSYTNTTKFHVTTKPGYELVDLNGENVEKNDFKKLAVNEYEFVFTDKGAEAHCYGKDVVFNLGTEKVVYTLKDKEGNVYGNVKVGEELPKAPEIAGHTFVGYTFNGYSVSTLDEKMIASANENNEIVVDPIYNRENVTITVKLFENNDESEVIGTEKVEVPYGAEITDQLLIAADENDQITNEYKIVGLNNNGINANGNTVIHMVKTRKATESNPKEYTFRYASATDGIKSVEYSINGSENKSIDMNETISVYNALDTIWDKTTVVFTVTTDGSELVLDCPGTQNTVTKIDDNTYSFQITVIGWNYLWDKPEHYDFHLAVNHNNK